MPDTRILSPSFVSDVQSVTHGKLPTVEYSSITTESFEEFKKILDEGVSAGKLFNGASGEGVVVSTYSLAYTTASAYFGGVLALNGDIHFVPKSATVGQKVSSAGVVSTYSLVNSSRGYHGGVLSLNGEIHFVPYEASRGQRVSSFGSVSTYSLAYTLGSGAYQGGVLSPMGEIHFVPYSARVGQKISATGVASTYSLAYTTNGAYSGGVLAPNGDIHFIPFNATVGQKISAAGFVSTYSLAYTGGGYSGGVLAPNGDIHFIPLYSSTGTAPGQKISLSGNITTYTTYYGWGGAISPTGTIYYAINETDNRFGKGIAVLNNDTAILYNLVYNNQNFNEISNMGAVLNDKNEIYFVPYRATVGQKIKVLSPVNFSRGTCIHPFFNKF